MDEEGKAMKKRSLSIPILVLAGLLALGPGRSAAQTPQWAQEWTQGWTQYCFGNIVRYLVDGGDYLWVGTNSGLVKLEKETGQETFYNGSNSPLHYGHIRFLKRDQQGSLWIGTMYG